MDWLLIWLVAALAVYWLVHQLLLLLSMAASCCISGVWVAGTSAAAVITRAALPAAAGA
jgi:hypothetical protein